MSISSGSSSNSANSKDANYSGIRELADAEQGLRNYYENIVNRVLEGKVATISKGNKTKILEFGAGTGFLAEIILEKTGIKADCVEIDPELIQIIRDKGFNCFENIAQIQEKYDLIYSSNVMEHIENDAHAFKTLRTITAENGCISVYVPAFMVLFSDLDRTVGHFRRYSKADLTSKVENAGFAVDSVKYVDSLGFPASLLIRFFGYKSNANLGGLRSMQIYDRFIFPLSRFLDVIGFQKLFGKNLILRASIKENSLE